MAKIKNQLDLHGIHSPQLSYTLPLCEKPNIEYFKENKLGGTWYCSEKYDGIRALWTGKELITRSWRPFTYVPDWFIVQLPIGTPLDGELYIPDVPFSYFSSLAITKETDVVNDKWKKIKFMVFDMPVVNTQFEKRLLHLQKLKNSEKKLGKQIHIINFTKINNIQEDFFVVNTLFKNITQKGGEGIMLIRSESLYEPKRTKNSLKYKKEHTGEATVIELCEGLGKYYKKLGKIKCKLPNGKTFYCGTGFSDAERNMYHFDKTQCEHIEDDTDTIKIPRIGDTITYSCMEIIQKTGIPRMSVYKGVRFNKE